MPLNDSPGEVVTRADLKAAVYAVVHSALAVSAVVLAVSLHAWTVLLCCALFGSLALFNAGRIGNNT